MSTIGKVINENNRQFTYNGNKIDKISRISMSKKPETFLNKIDNLVNSIWYSVAKFIAKFASWKVIELNDHKYVLTKDAFANISDVANAILSPQNRETAEREKLISEIEASVNEIGTTFRLKLDIPKLDPNKDLQYYKNISQNIEKQLQPFVNENAQKLLGLHEAENVVDSFIGSFQEKLNVLIEKFNNYFNNIPSYATFKVNESDTEIEENQQEIEKVSKEILSLKSDIKRLDNSNKEQLERELKSLQQHLLNFKKDNIPDHMLIRESELIQLLAEIEGKEEVEKILESKEKTLSQLEKIQLGLGETSIQLGNNRETSKNNPVSAMSMEEITAYLTSFDLQKENFDNELEQQRTILSEIQSKKLDLQNEIKEHLTNQLKAFFDLSDIPPIKLEVVTDSQIFEKRFQDSKERLHQFTLWFNDVKNDPKFQDNPEIQASITDMRSLMTANTIRSQTAR
ncbi:MAG: hypothetical protein K940chlam5_00466 [Candidatus Anoxychlamydiales bacterium]|nr:hypothetical protein [Candidatus Anoxychlamydiales bacterium]